MKRAILFFNGDLSNITTVKKYLKNDDFIICADGGTELVLKHTIKPHLIIGDFDSLSNTTQKSLDKNIACLSFSKQKDETDSELTMLYAVEKGYTDLLIFGLLGTRLDHLLSNILSLSLLEDKGIKALAIEGNQEIQVISKKIQLEGAPGDLLSLLPLKDNVEGITTHGLQYQLINETLYFGRSRGISNIFTKSKITITLTKGKLLIIHQRQ